MSLLAVRDLRVAVGDVVLLDGVSFDVDAGEVIALMGPNGSGKSTLAHVLMGHPEYQVTRGKVLYGGADLLSLSADERARAGLFLSFQHPHAVPGVSVASFLRLAYTATHDKPLSAVAFLSLLREQMAVLGIPPSFEQRSVNDGFSGGERKRMEMLQLLVLQPQLAILDEVDSGLDRDALGLVVSAIQALRSQRPDFSVVLITHYAWVLERIVPDKVVVLRDGNVVAEGGATLLQKVERNGYAGL